MKPVFICHPLAGEMEENIKRVKKICRELVSEEIIPIGPHLYFPQLLQDNDNVERKLGIKCGLFILKNFVKVNNGEMWVYGDMLSKGMVEEVKFCKKEDIPIICKNPKLEKEIEKI